MLFCSVYIVFGVLFLIYCMFFVCMYLCVAIDGAQFEGPQEQGFEDTPEQHQQYFEEGKWSLIIFRS
jgi:hypothetical protein